MRDRLKICEDLQRLHAVLLAWRTVVMAGGLSRNSFKPGIGAQSLPGACFWQTGRLEKAGRCHSCCMPASGCIGFLSLGWTAEGPVPVF